MAGYTPLFSSIITSSIWGQDSATRIVWITMLALADAKGIVEGSIPGLAHISRVTLEECTKALQHLSEPDPYSRTTDHEGRRIHKVDGGWQIYNFAAFRRRAKHGADYYGQWRAKKKNSPQTPLEENNPNEYPNEYPNKGNRAQPRATTRNQATSCATVAHTFTIPPDLETWKGYALQAGLTDIEAQNAYDNFAGNGWKRGNGVKIESWSQVPGLLRYWRNNRDQFQQKGKKDRKEEVDAAMAKLKAEGRL